MTLKVSKPVKMERIKNVPDVSLKCIASFIVVYLSIAISASTKRRIVVFAERSPRLVPRPSQSIG